MKSKFDSTSVFDNFSANSLFSLLGIDKTTDSNKQKIQQAMEELIKSIYFSFVLKNLPDNEAQKFIDLSNNDEETAFYFASSEIKNFEYRLGSLIKQELLKINS